VGASFFIAFEIVDNIVIAFTAGDTPRPASARRVEHARSDSERVNFVSR
jgi:hypothetical protein